MRSVRTTFQILEAVAENQPVGLSDLARRLELPKSTVQRSLSTLADLGWIRPDGRSRWALGDRVRSLSAKVDDVGELRDAAMPLLADLNLQTLETVHLVVTEGGTVRLVERIDSKHALRFVQPIGARSPLHAGSNGKAVLAYLPESEVEDYIAAGLASHTPRTITDPADLHADLAVTRERGYAVADNELSEGIVSVAASVRPGNGRPVGSISISGPTVRMTPERCVTYGQLVSQAADEVSRRLSR